MGEARTREGGGTTEGRGGMGARHRVPGQLVRDGGRVLRRMLVKMADALAFVKLNFCFVTLAGVETEAPSHLT